MCVGELRAAPSIGIKPVPSWVVPVTPEGKAPSAKDFADGFYLAFSDVQVNLEKKTTYRRTITQIVSESGVQNGSELAIAFDPSYEHVDLHSLIVWRNGVAIPRLNIADFNLIPIESDRQRFIYNGYYTASVILKDIRKGDRIELVYSRTGWNPVFRGKFSDIFSFASSDYIGHIHTAVHTRTDRALFMKSFNNPPARQEKILGGLRVHEWNAKEVKRIQYDDNVPEWYDQSPFVQITEFRNWKEVVDWGLNFYSVPEVSGSLKNKVDEWKKSSQSTLEYIEKAVRFVQDDVRYLGIETGENSHRPHNPEDVFNQRYGDCKDKTFLLCAILKANDIEANPVLINTYKRSRLDDYLPTPTDFNHVVARVRVSDRAPGLNDPKDFVYIDATIALQGGAIPMTYFPPYSRGLVLKQGITGPFEIPAQNHGKTEITEDIYLPSVKNNAFDGALEVKTVYFGPNAENYRSYLQGAALSEVEESYLKFYKDLYDQARFRRLDSIEFYDQREANNFSVFERYLMNDAWKTDSSTGSTYFDIIGKVLYDQLLALPSSERKSPLYLNYPAHMGYTIRVHMPEPWTVPAEEWKIEREAYQIKFKSEFIPVENIWQLTYSYQTKQDFIATEDVVQYKADIDKLVKNLEFRLDSSEGYLSGWADINGWMMLLALLTLAGCFWKFRELRAYSPGNPMHSEPRNIGGWLYLVAVNLYGLAVLLPFVYFAQDQSLSLTWSGWNKLTAVSDSMLAGYHALLIVQTIGNTAIWAFTMFLAWLFYHKRDSFPTLYSNFMGLRLVFVILNTTFLYAFFFDTSSATFDVALRDVAREVIAAAIWITYMYKSKRVKRTFLNTYADQIGVATEESEIAESQ